MLRPTITHCEKTSIVDILKMVHIRQLLSMGLTCQKTIMRIANGIAVNLKMVHNRKTPDTIQLRILRLVKRTQVLSCPAFINYAQRSASGSWIQTSCAMSQHSSFEYPAGWTGTEN
jgi:hypothetical protein